MKSQLNILALIVLIFGADLLQGQQLPIYNQFKYNQFVYNPAVSSLNNEVAEITLLHRNQWAGVAGAPETSLVSYNGVKTENNIGYAAFLYHDNTGIMNTTSFYANYAYGFKVIDDFTINLGLSAGLVNKGLDQSKVSGVDMSDPLFQSNTSGQTTFDFNAGVNFSYLNFDLGFSVPQLFANSIKYSQEEGDSSMVHSLKRHYVSFLSYTYTFDIKSFGQYGEGVKLVPSVLMRSAANTPVQVDAHVLFDVKKLGWLGAGFRSNMGPIFNLGVNLSEDLSLGYAYELNSSKFVGEFGSTHEMALIYRLGANKRLVDNVTLALEEAKREDIARMNEMEQELIKRQDSIAALLRKDIVVNANQLISSNEMLEAHGKSFLIEDDITTTASNVVAGSRGYYVVAGVFAYKKNAESLTHKLAGEGYDVEYFYNNANKYYYVFLRKYSTYEAALLVTKSNINGTYFDELWIKEVK